MKMKAEYVLLGVEERKGKKDPSKIYRMALFGQGTETLNCMCEDRAYEDLVASQLYTPVECLFDFNGQYGSIRCLNVIA